MRRFRVTGEFQIFRHENAACVCVCVTQGSHAGRHKAHANVSLEIYICKVVAVNTHESIRQYTCWLFRATSFSFTILSQHSLNSVQTFHITHKVMFVVFQKYFKIILTMLLLLTHLNEEILAIKSSKVIKEKFGSEAVIQN